MITLKIDTHAATKALTEAARKQIPFAMAKAVNQIAFEVQRAERAAMTEVFAHPRPFTQKSVLVTKATKASPIATVFIKPEVAKYLAPYEFGGKHELPGKGTILLNPKNIRLDQYGQIRGKPRAIGDKANVFAGVVQTKSGPVWGFWQRMKGKRGGPRLKLLARSGEALTVKKRLGFDQTARVIVAKDAGRVFEAALDAALRSAR